MPDHSHRIRIGARIRELRQDAGMTQQQLADATGLKQQNINRVEQGVYSVTLDVLSKIATALGRSVDLILLDAY